MQLPLPPKAERVFDLDARRARVYEEEEVMALSGGERLVAGRSHQCRYVGKKNSMLLHKLSLCCRAACASSQAGRTSGATWGGKKKNLCCYINSLCYRSQQERHVRCRTATRHVC